MNNVALQTFQRDNKFMKLLAQIKYNILNSVSNFKLPKLRDCEKFLIIQQVLESRVDEELF